MKKSLARLIAMMLLISMFTSFAMIAEATAINDNQFEVVSLRYRNDGGTGSDVISLWDNGHCWVKATIRRIGAEADQATLIGVVYKGDEVDKVVMQKEQFLFPGVKKEFSLDCQFPESSAGCDIKVFLWNSIDGLMPLGKPGRYLNYASNTLDMIYINGYEVPGFTPDVTEYTVSLPASSVGTPEIFAVATDMATKYEVAHDTEQSKIVVKAIPRGGKNSEGKDVSYSNGGGEAKEYTINYDIAEPTAKVELVYDYTASGTTTKKTEEVGFANRDLLPISWVKNDDGSYGLGTNENAIWTNYATRIYKDTRRLYVDVPEELQGAKVVAISGAKNASANTPIDYSDMVAKLTLNKSATFYFTSTEANAKLSGATHCAIADQVKYANPTTYSDLVKLKPDTISTAVIGNFNKFGADKIYKLDLIVPEGVESKTFEIPIVGSSNKDQFPPILWLKWIDETEVNVSDITITGKAMVDGELVEKTYTKAIRADRLKLPEWKTDENGNLLPTVFGNPETGLGWNEKVTRVTMGSTYSFYAQISDELLGAQIISSSREDLWNKDYTEGGVSKPGAYATECKVKFTLDKTATIYLYDQSDKVKDSYGAELSGYTLKYIASNQNFAGTGKREIDPATVTYHDLGNKLYKFECIVPEGEDSATFEFEITNPTYEGPILFIK